MKQDESINYRRYILMLLIIVIIIAIFTAIDYLIHLLSEEYGVPSYYFRNKLIFGVIIGYISLLLVTKINWWQKSLVLSSAVSILLQVRYFLEGYPINFVLEFLLIHFLILLPTTLVILKLAENKWSMPQK